MKSRLLMGVGVLGCSAFLLAFIPSVQASRVVASASAVVVAPQPLTGGQGSTLCGGDKGTGGTGGEGSKLCGGDKGKGGTGGEGTKLCGGDKGKDGSGGEGSKLGAGCGHDKPASQAAD